MGCIHKNLHTLHQAGPLSFLVGVCYTWNRLNFSSLPFVPRMVHKKGSSHCPPPIWEPPMGQWGGMVFAGVVWCCFFCWHQNQENVFQGPRRKENVGSKWDYLRQGNKKVKSRQNKIRVRVTHVQQASSLRVWFSEGAWVLTLFLFGVQQCQNGLPSMCLLRCDVVPRTSTPENCENYENANTPSGGSPRLPIMSSITSKCLQCRCGLMLCGGPSINFIFWAAFAQQHVLIDFIIQHCRCLRNFFSAEKTEHQNLSSDKSKNDFWKAVILLESGGLGRHEWAIFSKKINSETKTPKMQVDRTHRTKPLQALFSNGPSDDPPNGLSGGGPPSPRRGVNAVLCEIRVISMGWPGDKGWVDLGDGHAHPWHWSTHFHFFFEQKTQNPKWTTTPPVIPGAKFALFCSWDSLGGGSRLASI